MTMLLRRYSTTDRPATQPLPPPVDWIVACSCRPKAARNLVLSAAANAHLSDDDAACADRRRSLAGEDAFFRASTARFACLGAADGVGGWTASGVDPSLFAWELMDRTKRACERLVDPMPRLALEQAYRELLNGGRVMAGGSTACVLMLDKSNGILHSANLGDTGYLVLRRSDQQAFTSMAAGNGVLFGVKQNSNSYAPRLFPADDDILMDHLSEENAIITTTATDDSQGCLSASEDDSLSVGASSVSSDTTASTLAATSFKSVKSLLDSSSKSSLPFYRPIHRSKEMTHYFNAPFQLSLLPASVPASSRHLYISDTPDDADVESFGPLLPGDIVVVGTDGLWDNIYVEEIESMIRAQLASPDDDDEDSTCSNGHDIKDNNSKMCKKLQRAADCIVEMAARLSTTTRMSPFAVEARKHGWSEYRGGKVDDITVLVACVVEDNVSEKPTPSATPSLSL